MDGGRSRQLFWLPGRDGLRAYELLLPFLTPLAWGILLAFVADPALEEVEKSSGAVRCRPRSSASWSGLGVILPAIWASSRLVVEAQALYTQASATVNNGGVTKLHDWAVDTQACGIDGPGWRNAGTSSTNNCPSGLFKRRKMTSNYVAQNATQAAKNVFGFIIDFGITLLAFSTCCATNNPYRGLRNLTPLHEDDHQAIFDTLRTTLSSVIRGLMLTAVLQGVSIGIGLLIFGVPYWLFLAIASAAAGLMPIGGTALVWIPAVLYLGFRCIVVDGDRPVHLVRGRARHHRQFHQAARDEARHRPADDRAVSRNPRRPRSRTARSACSSAPQSCRCSRRSCASIERNTQAPAKKPREPHRRKIVKYAIVTGGARGLGLGIVNALLEEKVVESVAVIDRELAPPPAAIASQSARLCRRRYRREAGARRRRGDRCPLRRAS